MGYTEDIEPVRRCGTPFVDEIRRDYWEYKNGLSKIVIEVADRQTAIFLLGSIEDYLDRAIDEKEIAKIIDTRIE